jgi:hypothetical protein
MRKETYKLLGHSVIIIFKGTKWKEEEEKNESGFVVGSLFDSYVYANETHSFFYISLAVE